MKYVRWTTSLLVVAAMSMVACQPKEKEADRTTISINAKMAADDLTSAGEQLIGPYTFHLADRAFELALEKNPEDQKALFYRAFLKRFMVFKGVLTRVKPYARQYGNPKDIENIASKFPNHPFKTFLLDASGKKDIADAEGLQILLTEYQGAINEFREYALKNQDLELDLYMNPSIFKEKIEENIKDSCVIPEGSSAEDMTVECRTQDIVTVKVNVADIIALRQQAAGEVLMYSLFTSYSVKGIEPLMKDIGDDREVCTGGGGHWDSQRNEWISVPYECRRVGRQISRKEIHERLSMTPGFGRLRKENTLKLVHGLGADFSRAAKWVMEYQSALCPRGAGSSDVLGRSQKQRPGFLIDGETFCMGNLDEVKASVALLDQALAGLVRMTVDTENGEKHETDVNIFALFNNPVKDLRDLFPASWDDCGGVGSLKDKTFGGMYPNGDAEKIMIKRCE